MKDFLPPTPVTLIKDFLQAIIANGLHARMMKSYVVSFRCSQSITDYAHKCAQIHHAHVAWISSFPVSWHEVGHGLHARSKTNMHWDTWYKSFKITNHSNIIDRDRESFRDTLPVLWCINSPCLVDISCLWFWEKVNLEVQHGYYIRVATTSLIVCITENSSVLFILS